MISLIICSVRPDVCQKMLDSVAKTIGTEYEAIVFDNREKQYGICRAYNEAAKYANGGYLCFVHEDIVIKTEGWGRRLIDFSNKTDNCGVIGIAGGKNALNPFFDWGGDGKNSRYRYYDPPVGIEKTEGNCYDSGLVYRYRNPKNEEFTKSVALDGLFLFTSRKIWEENPFDENYFTGFHFYDADFTFAIAQKHQNYVYFGIEVYHFSGGSPNKAYCDNILLFQKKWNDCLPYCLPGYEVSLLHELNSAAAIFHLHRKNAFSRMKSLKRIYSMSGALFTALLCCGLFVKALLRFVMRRPKVYKKTASLEASAKERMK